MESKLDYQAKYLDEYETTFQMCKKSSCAKLAAKEKLLSELRKFLNSEKKAIIGLQSFISNSGKIGLMKKCFRYLSFILLITYIAQSDD